jgi:hypothetical protein
MMSGWLHAPAALPPGKSPHCQLDRRLAGPQIWSERYGEEEYFGPVSNPTLAIQPISHHYTN